ncbi:MAG: DUF805 domain-containing protein [Rhizobiales bacterium]|nr:DUF805 domain-containing protein [Hyphomicrobiales bacterium]
MDFISAIQSVLTKYVGFSGRACRSEYWWFYLFSIMVIGVTPLLLGHNISSFVSLLLILPTIAVTVRRLHDVNRSGWWLGTPFLVLLITGAILVLSKGEAAGFAGFVIFPLFVVGIYLFYLYTKKVM